jgi:hypothetical protein
VIEMMRFRLAPDAAEDEFLAADRSVQEDFAYQQPGLLRRTTARDDQGNWLVIDLWRSRADSSASESRWDGDPVVERFMSFVDRGTLSVEHYETLD